MVVRKGVVAPLRPQHATGLDKKKVKTKEKEKKKKDLSRL
jgi:hypothetical protein